MSNVINLPALDRQNANREREEARLAAVKAANLAKRGERYESVKDLDVTDIAKLVRADLKAAVKSGAILPLKYGVTISRYSMGRDITITINGLRPTVSNAEHEMNQARGVSCPRLTRAGARTEDGCEAILAAYNRDDSDSMSDYYSTHFAANVRWA